MGVEHDMKYNFQFSIFNFQKTSSQRGFTILLAALIASLVLALGIAVFSIAQKELILSSTGRNSELAFYAADTGAECALYWDMRHSAFDPLLPVTPLTCDGNAAINVAASGVSYPVSYTFSFDPNGYCVQLTVTKDTVHPRTRIHADGFSVACSDIEASGRALQRSVELTY